MTVLFAPCRLEAYKVQTVSLSLFNGLFRDHKFLLNVTKIIALLNLLNLILAFTKLATVV